MKNKTSFLRVKKSENYTVISNSIIKSTDYTSQEKDILFYLLHLPDDWVIYKENIKKHYKGSISSKKFDDSWQRLKTKGHIQGSKIKLQNGKYSSWEYKIVEQPITDIPNSELSEIGVVENLSTQNLGDILSTNTLSTNEQNTKGINLNNTSNILGDKELTSKKKIWTEKEIQIDIIQKSFASIFNDTGIKWEIELNTLSNEEFIQKHLDLTSNTGDDFKIRYLVENYFKLKNK